MRYLETSAKQADNVEKLFVQIASELMEVINKSCTFLNFINILLTAKNKNVNILV